MARDAGKSPAQAAGLRPAGPSAAVGVAAENVDPLPSVSAKERERMIREAAYRRFEQRAFAHGYDLEDWLAAEAEVDAMIARQQQPEQVEMPDPDVQGSGGRSILRDERMKRILKRHPQRDAPKV